jgi:hypothetical protein
MNLPLKRYDDLDDYNSPPLAPQATTVPFKSMSWVMYLHSPGHDSYSPNVVEIDRNKRNLNRILERCLTDNSPFSTHKFTAKTILYAQTLIKSLPENATLPKLASDGEGGLVMIWKGNSVLLVTVDEEYIHIVPNAGTRHATFLAPMALDGDSLPRELSEAIRAI